ncbi:HMG-CoA synthase [Schistosoma mansoni]|uniref:HMG-CoA synthase n=1 Tax=Schistosoma mansoni TaxID=6183 RepID=UPI00022C84CD|nr:HMG-CoA synthase [Schistosoma mansoni]|eukprot:XP_018644995.1 HMG-CoA synthase [Schistosoma mansoni]
MDNTPDLSHLTPEERKIIEDVMNRQKQEEAKDSQLVSKTIPVGNQNIRDPITTTRSTHITNPSEKSSANITTVNGKNVNKLSSTNNTNTSLPFGNTVVNLMAEAAHAVTGGSTGTSGGVSAGHSVNVCESCHKTKFADVSGNPCIYCKRRTCIRCGGHMEIKPNVVHWVCKQCAQNLTSDRQIVTTSGANLPHHTESLMNSSIAGRLGESIKDSIYKPKSSDGKRQLPQLNIKNQNVPYISDGYRGQTVQRTNSGRTLSMNRSNSLDADKTAYISPNHSVYHSDQQRPFGDKFIKYDQIPGEYGHSAKSRHTPGAYYLPDEITSYRDVNNRYPPNDPRLLGNPYLDPTYPGDSFPSDPSDSPCQSGGGGDSATKYGLSYGKGSAHEFGRHQEIRCRSDQNFPSQSPYYKQNYSSSPFSAQRRNKPNWETYRYGAVPPRYRDQLRHHQLHHLSFSSSDGEDFSVVDDGSVLYQEPRRRLLPTNFERKNSPYSQGTVTDDDDPASQFYISKRSTTPYYDRQLKPNVWDQDKALSLCDEPPVRYAYSDVAQPAYHRQLPENRSMGYQKDVQYNHKDGTVVRKRLPPNISSSQPVTWSVSENGKHLIGHMILQKKTDPHSGEPGLGLKLAGGRLNKSGRLSAFVTQIKPGSPADIIGHLKSGDEILEWNGQSLRGLSADDVSQIIYQSRDELQVELLAQRELNEPDNTPTDDFVLMVPNRSDCLNPNEMDSVEHNIKSSLHLKLFYDEIKHQLIVSILEARNLPNINKASRMLCNFYCRLCLLPEQVEYNSRCTKLASCSGNNTNPVWNQVFRFTNFTDDDLNKLHLEITIWNCNEYSDEQYKVGEIVIDLSVADLLDVGYWYPIKSFHRFFSATELSNMNPDVNSTPYDLQPCTTQVPERLIKSRHRESEQQWSPKSEYRNSDIPGDNTRKLKSIRDDYSDIDEQRFFTSIRQNRKFTDQEYYRDENEGHHRGSRLHPSAQNFEYGALEENAIQSDASEFSDLSELSRMSLHTSQSDRQRKESMQTSRKGSQQFETPTQSYNERHSRNLQKPDRLDQDFLPSVERSTRARRDSNRIDKDIIVPTEDEEQHELITKDSRNFERGSSPRISSPDNYEGGQVSRSLIENKVSNFETAQNVHRDQVDGRKRRPNIGQKFSNVLGRSSKSSSTSTLDKKSRTSFQRSEEVLPFGGYGAIFEGQEQEGSFNRGRLSMMHCQSSIGSGKSDGRNSRYGTNSDNTDQESVYMGRNESHVGEFVEGLGPGQLVGRQVLGMPCLGEIQLSFYDRKGHLEVEVIRARGLQQKNTAKPLPAPYVKLHLLEGKQSVEKLRTMYPPRRTLDPLYQQQLCFSMPYHGKILQISVWGEYGRMDKKVFLGMCEIVLDDLDLKTVVFGWYKLFGMIASNAQHHHHHHPPHQKQQQQQQQQRRKSLSSSSTLLDNSQDTNNNNNNNNNKLIGSKLDKLTNRSSSISNTTNMSSKKNNNEKNNRTKSKSSQDINKSTHQSGLNKNNNNGDRIQSNLMNMISPHSIKR